MEYDLKDDDDLRFACELRLSGIRDGTRFKRAKAFVQKIADESEKLEKFVSEKFQEDLWGKENPICQGESQGLKILVKKIIKENEELFHSFYKDYGKIKKKESQKRTNDLCALAKKLHNDLKKYTNKNQRPVYLTYRALAALFPENFTCIASTKRLSHIASQMGINVHKDNTLQVVKGHRKILDQFAKVLGDPGDLDEVIQRMILPWGLPDATSQEELEEEQNMDVPKLDDILKHVNSKGYFPDDLCQKLHLGLWADERRHFAVLTGLSGAGKTLLARAYAEAITGEDPTGENPERSCIVAVQPGWTDPSYLLGYANPLQNDTFEKTPFLELLLRATDRPHMPHVAILDEMNLSHPEQYMAPLLSAMETGGNIEIHGRGEKFDGVPQSIKYPNNLVMIGTVNMDETTHGLVDKILDRAFTLEFWKVNVDKWPGWEKNELPTEEEKQVKEILNALMKALEPARLHFGYRVIEEIVAFLTCRPKDWPPESALDSIVYAKVLPKLRGDDSTRIRKALSDCKEVLDNYSLNNSAKKVQELYDDLEATGSARFWR